VRADQPTVAGCERLSGPAYRWRRGRTRAACGWDPGVVLTLLISRFRIAAAAVGPVGLWATPLRVVHKSTGLRARGELRPAQLAWREVRTCRIGEAGTAPTSTAKSRTDAVPHTVLSTHAGAVFQSLPIASMCAVGGGDDWPAVPVRALPSSGFCLQPL
jgi:hypothetical protein